MLKALTLLAATGSAALFSAPSFAQDTETIVSGTRPEDVAVVYVKYGDLNLTSEAGVQRLQRRVRSAARSVCIENGTVPLFQRMADRKCFDSALDGAAPQIARAIEQFGNSKVASRQTITVRGAN